MTAQNGHAQTVVRLLEAEVADLQARLAALEQKRDVEWRQFVALSREDQIADLRKRWADSEARVAALTAALEEIRDGWYDDEARMIARNALRDGRA